MPTEPETTVIAEFNDAGSMCRVMSDETLERETYPRIWEWQRKASIGEVQFAKRIRSLESDLAAAVKALEDLTEIVGNEIIGSDDGINVEIDRWKSAVVAAKAVIEKAKHG